MTLIQTTYLNCISLYMGKQGSCFAEVGVLNPMFKISAKEPKPDLLSIVDIVTFNIQIINTINHLPELTVSVAEQIIDIICIQEYRHCHRELELKYYGPDNG